MPWRKQRNKGKMSACVRPVPVGKRKSASARLDWDWKNRWLEKKGIGKGEGK